MRKVVIGLACTAVAGLGALFSKTNRATRPKFVINLNSSIFKAYKNFTGKVQYYVFEKKSAGISASFAGHKMVIVRPLDPAARSNRSPLIMHLVHDGKWYCEIAKKEGGWTPPNDTCVKTSMHEWTLGQALSKIMDTMDAFGSYRFVTNNCRKFLQDTITKMQDTGPPELLQPPSTDDDFKNMCIDRQYTLNIQPLWRYYACERDQQNVYARKRTAAQTTDLLASACRKIPKKDR